MNGKTIKFCMSEDDTVIDEVCVLTTEEDRSTCIEITRALVNTMVDCGFENCDKCEQWVKKSSCTSKMFSDPYGDVDYQQFFCSRCMENHDSDPLMFHI